MYKKILIVLILFVCLIILVFKKDNEIVINKGISQNILYYNNEGLNNKEKYIDNRYIKLDSNYISIGNNLNEIDNGYYDIQIIIDEQYITIYVNKLFKYFEENIIYDDTYLDEIITFITNILDIDLKELKNEIKLNYEKIKNIDNNEVINKNLIIDNYKINIYEEDNILIIKIGDK